MASTRNISLDLPEDLDPASPDFIPTLNDRLRRISDFVSKSVQVSANQASGVKPGPSGRALIGDGLGADPKFIAAGDTLDLSGTILRAPNGTIGLSGTILVRNSAGTGFLTFHLSDGIITSVT